MPKLLLIFGLLSVHAALWSQGEFFAKSYAKHPNVPHGLLEAIAYTHTRFLPVNEDTQASCSEMPLPIGIMGTFEQGNRYFTENAKIISNLSNISVSEQKQSLELEIEAYASACDKLIETHDLKGEKTEAIIYALMWELSEIPHEGMVNAFAFESSVLEVLRFLCDEEHAAKHNFRQHQFDLISLFGPNNYSVLTAAKIRVSEHQIQANNNTNYLPPKKHKSVNYGPALWNAAPACNFSSRNGIAVSAVTIHTVQGSYAGAISWGLNCNSQVSYHYVVRSSDGQVTQMVLESNKAWHVGSENSYTIGIEHEGYVSNPAWYTAALYQSSANLVKDITQSGYGINPLRTYDGISSTSTQLLGNCIRIKGHQHYANQSHTDPGIHWNWNKYYGLINANYNPILITNTNGTLYDSGGASGNYASDERNVWVIQGNAGTQINLSFSAFDLEASFDKLLIYDGQDMNAPLIGSFSGNTLPPQIQSSSNSLLLEFRSDCATQLSGWVANYQCTQNLIDQTPPASQISYNGTWQNQNFNAQFQDNDNASGVALAFYNVSSRCSGQAPFYSNGNYSFFRDEMDTVSGLWTNQSGAYSVQNGTMQQSDANQNNSNGYAQITQDVNHTYLYTWKQRFISSNANQRAGMHFFCSDPTLSNRGNSYFIYFREENDKVQIYKVINDVFTLEKEDSASVQNYTWYSIQVLYNPSNGKIDVYMNQQWLCSWTDPSPLQNGNSISLRTGACKAEFDEVFVYVSHGTQENISLGMGAEIENQSDHGIESGAIRTLALDSAGNWNNATDHLIQVDWTAPLVVTIDDGLQSDIDTIYQPHIEGNWVYDEPHSAVNDISYFVGQGPGLADLIPITSLGTSNSFSASPSGMNPGSVYYTSISIANLAGLQANACSDGQRYINQATASFLNPLEHLVVFPNPVTHGSLSIQNLSFPVNMKLIDANGKIVLDQALSHDCTINLDVSNGVYQLHLNGNGYQLTKKIMVF